MTLEEYKNKVFLERPEVKEEYERIKDIKIGMRMSNMKCPLMKNGNDNRECLRAGCAWFIRDKQSCAICAIAESIDMLRWRI